MCYVLDFEFDDSYKACKFTAFPRTFQIINYLFFKEVYNRNNYSILHDKNMRAAKINHKIHLNSLFSALQFKKMLSFMYFCFIKEKK